MIGGLRRGEEGRREVRGKVRTFAATNGLSKIDLSLRSIMGGCGGGKRVKLQRTKQIASSDPGNGQEGTGV